MTNGLHFISGAIAGIAVGGLLWGQVVALHPIFSLLALSGLVSWFVAGIASGAVAGAAAPHHKISFAVGVGLFVSIVFLAFVLQNGWSHYDRNPFLWYGPIAVVPMRHALGGFLARGVWRVA